MKNKKILSLLLAAILLLSSVHFSAFSAFSDTISATAEASEKSEEQAAADMGDLEATTNTFVGANVSLAEIICLNFLVDLDSTSNT